MVEKISPRAGIELGPLDQEATELPGAPARLKFQDAKWYCRSSTGPYFTQ